LSYNILFLGDIVGEPGRKVVREGLPHLQDAHQPLFTIVNGENSAAGVGITPKIADELFTLGIDVITLGNHTYNKREIGPYLDTQERILRPGNYSSRLPGHGHCLVEKDGVSLAVLNLSGRVEMDPVYDDPFAAFDVFDAATTTPHRFLDFHAEATSEKIAMGWHADGRATAVVGTHTHVTTADERVLPEGTAYITDVGMTGPRDSVLGMDRHLILRRFRGSLPERFEVAPTPGVISGVSISVEKETGCALSISRIRFGD
jgi:metallophosphoesterase (TIGR00282 family)